jgi:hypothetical protein
VTRSHDVSRPTRTRSTAFSILVGLAALAVLLQGLWAGIFLEHDGARDAAGSWIEVHATGGEVAIALAALATVAGFVQLRERRDLWVGSLVLTALLVLEAYLGGLIRDDGVDSLTAVHIPLAMALMALAVWLPLRASPPSLTAGGAGSTAAFTSSGPPRG